MRTEKWRVRFSTRWASWSRLESLSVSWTRSAFRMPVVVEIILERVTNISMGTEISAINEFEDLAASGTDAPTAISMLD